MHPIVTLTMNPAVDVSASVERIEPVHKLRCTAAHRDAGGGGINVARVARRLGADPVAIYPAGGPVGALLDRAIAAEDVRHIAVSIAGDTREDFTINETALHRQFRFVLAGPELSQGEIKACLDALATQVRPSAYLVASGSLPPGVPADFYGSIACLSANGGTKFVLDCSGQALRSALGPGTFLIKPNLREFCELIGRDLHGREECLSAARGLVAEGATLFVALTLGEDGAMLVGKDIALFAAAPKVDAISTVGAGDSFLGALVFALASGQGAEDALSLGVAAGSAALLSPGTDLCEAQTARRLLSQIRVERLQDQKVVSSIS